MRRLAWLLLWVLGAFQAQSVTAALSPPGGEAKSVALVVDTSNSMKENDPERYTSEVSQIISDLVDDGDQLTVVRMPQGGLLSLFSCSDGPNPALAISSDGGDRVGFKGRLDALLTYDTGTFFAAPIRTAIAALSPHADRPRLLLVVADSGGLGDCGGPLTKELSALRRSGATVAAINLGRSAGAFEGNPAFEITASARDASQLIAAVAQVYQRFLGGRRVATGDARGEIRVEIAPAVREAFLVFAADGPLGEVREGEGNPSAQHVELIFRGGGGARGLDGRSREYRIVRMSRPQAGSWKFTASSLATAAGWMLIQDSSLGVRLASPTTLAAGMATALEVELIDEETGARVEDAALLPGLRVAAELDGTKLSFTDDGRGPDRQAGDGIFTATVEPNRPGRHEIEVQLSSELLERQRRLGLEVLAGGWRLVPSSPDTAEAGTEVTLSAKLEPIGKPPLESLPAHLEAAVGAEVLSLLPEPGGGRLYQTLWTPREPGELTLDYRAVGGAEIPPARGHLRISGSLDLGAARTIELGPVGGDETATGSLDLSGARVLGEFILTATTQFQSDGAELEIEIDSGEGRKSWVALGERPVSLALSTHGAKSWPLRLRTGACPVAVPQETFALALRQPNPGASLDVPFTVTVLPEPWWVCWWPALALIVALVATAVLIHGFLSPSRFAPRVGVMLSPEVDLGEGFFHPIRATRGSGSGFYRDAAVYLCADYRLSGRSAGAVARLRARGRGLTIRPLQGATLSRQASDGGWENLPQEESTLRPGTLYRHDLANLYFEVRHG